LFNKTSIRVILGVLILAVVTDGFLTNILINKGIAREANPFLFEIAGSHGLIIIKTAGVFMAVIILWDIYRRSPRLSFWVSLTFLLVYIMIVVWNLRLLIILE
jgi:hypothetical protein